MLHFGLLNVMSVICVRQVAGYEPGESLSW